MKEKYKNLANNGLVTTRLVFRKIKYSDAEDFYDLRKNKDTGYMAGWEPHKSIEETEKKIAEILKEENKATFAIAEKETDRFIGTISFMPDFRKQKEDALEIGYSILEKYRNRGYSKEAILFLIKKLFEEYDTKIVTAYIFPENTISINLVEKLGFIKEKTYLNSYRMHDGECRNEICFMLKKEDYIKMFHVEH